MNRTRNLILPLAIFGTVIGLWFGYQAWIQHRYHEMELRAQHGDMFGGLNALFAGLAFAGLIYTILLQREELALQRRELELTREELHRTAKANEEAAKALELQIRNQLLAARISGLSALLASMNERLAETARENEGYRLRGASVHADNPDARKYRNKFEEELENLLNEIKKSADHAT